MSFARVLRDHPGVVLSPLSLILILAIWEIISRAGLVSPLVLPAPSRIWDGLVILLTADWFPQHVWRKTGIRSSPSI